MIKDKSFIFIIGAPRSGTTWLHRILSSHPAVASTDVEMSIFFRYVAPLVKGFETELKAIEDGKWRQGLPHLWTRKEFDERILWLINEMYSSFPVLPEHKAIIDKHPFYSFYTETINYYLPEAKYIHLVRDGRDVAYSWHEIFNKRGFGNPTFEGACNDWTNFKNAARTAQKFQKNNYLEIKYETLTQNINQELGRILEFCNLDNSKEIAESIISKHTGEENMVSVPDKSVSYSDRIKGKPLWQTRLSGEEMYIAKKLIGQELIKEGYEINLNWGPGNFQSLFYFFKKKSNSALKRLGILHR